MKDLRGKVAVITGAASGMGRGLAVKLAQEGCIVAISDVNEAGLEETADLVKRRGGWSPPTSSMYRTRRPCSPSQERWWTRTSRSIF